MGVCLEENPGGIHFPDWYQHAQMLDSAPLALGSHFSRSSTYGFTIGC